MPTFTFTAVDATPTGDDGTSTGTLRVTPMRLVKDGFVRTGKEFSVPLVGGAAEVALDVTAPGEAYKIVEQVAGGNGGGYWVVVKDGDTTWADLEVVSQPGSSLPTPIWEANLATTDAKSAAAVIAAEAAEASANAAQSAAATLTATVEAAITGTGGSADTATQAATAATNAAAAATGSATSAGDSASAAAGSASAAAGSATTAGTAANNAEVARAAAVAAATKFIQGTGSPLGVVTATPGAVYIDTTAAAGASQWLKLTGTGTAGWVVMFGDTGKRNISAVGSTLINTTDWSVANGSATLRRAGSTVELTVGGSSVQANSTAGVLTLPVGFRPTGNLSNVIASGSSTHTISVSGSSSPLAPASAQSALRWVLNWTTLDAWPTTLPGIPG